MSVPSRDKTGIIASYEENFAGLIELRDNITILVCVLLGILIIASLALAVH